MSQKITTTFTSSSSQQQQQIQYGLILNPSKKLKSQSILQSTSTNDVNSKIDTPLLSKGKTSYNEDIQSCPDSSSLSDYKNVPISSFGLRMLKNLGWEEGQPLGKSSKHSLLKPIEYIPRPNLLGLGADPSSNTSSTAPSLKRKSPEYIVPQTKEGKRRYIKSIDETLKVKETLQVHSQIKIIHGIHAGLLGLVKELSSSSKVKISLTNGELVYVPFSYIKLVSEIDSRTSIQNSSIPNDDTLHMSTFEPLWIHPGLHVRMISKTFQNGMYYNKKAWIVDVLPGNLALLQLDQDLGTKKLVDHVPQSYLETLIPSMGGKVMIVKKSSSCIKEKEKKKEGEAEENNEVRVGSLAKILMKNKQQQECVCALEEDESLVFVLAFDQICEVKLGM